MENETGDGFCIALTLSFPLFPPKEPELRPNRNTLPPSLMVERKREGRFTAGDIYLPFSMFEMEFSSSFFSFPLPFSCDIRGGKKIDSNSPDKLGPLCPPFLSFFLCGVTKPCRSLPRLSPHPIMTPGRLKFFAPPFPSGVLIR